MYESLALGYLVFASSITAIVGVCMFSTAHHTYRSGPERDCNAIVILGSGGHTTEMLSIIGALGSRHKLHVVVSQTDTTSLAKLGAKKVDLVPTYGRLDSECRRHISYPVSHRGAHPMEKVSFPDAPRFFMCIKQDLKRSVSRVSRLPRAREVHQSYMTSVPTTLYALIHAFRLVFNSHPDLVICNGPGTCIPVLVSVAVLRFVGLVNTKTVYVESFARTKSLSMSGKIAYRIVDRFVIQWQSLIVDHPSATFKGILC